MAQIVYDESKDPDITPPEEGRIWVNNSSDTAFISTGTSSSSDWDQISTSGASSNRFTETRTLTADTAETFNHSLGFQYVHVTVADSNGNLVDGYEVDFTDANNLDITASIEVANAEVVISA